MTVASMHEYLQQHFGSNERSLSMFVLEKLRMSGDGRRRDNVEAVRALHGVTWLPNRGGRQGEVRADDGNVEETVK